MSSLNKSRSSNSTTGEDFAQDHSDLERAASKIFGLTPGELSYESIFGSVAADGSVHKISFKSDASSPVDAAGVMITTGSLKRFLCIVNNTLKLYKNIGSTWSQVIDYENIADATIKPSSSQLTDCTRVGTLTPSYALKVVNGSVFGLGPDTVVGGKTKFFDLDDTYFPIGRGAPGYYITVVTAPSGPALGQTAPPPAVQSARYGTYKNKGDYKVYNGNTSYTLGWQSTASSSGFSAPSGSSYQYITVKRGVFKVAFHIIVAVYNGTPLYSLDSIQGPSIRMSMNFSNPNLQGYPLTGPAPSTTLVREFPKDIIGTDLGKTGLLKNLTNGESSVKYPIGEWVISPSSELLMSFSLLSNAPFNGGYEMTITEIK
jgi:hypothetical protein